MKQGKICIYPGCNELAWMSSYCKKHNYERRRERMRKHYAEHGSHTQECICAICNRSFMGKRGSTKYCELCRDKVKDATIGHSKYVPRKIKGAKIEQHRLVAKSLGVITASDDVVHHIDGNRSNNTPNNLIVLSLQNHGKLHAYLREAIVKHPEESVEHLTMKFLLQNYIPFCKCDNIPDDNDKI